MPDTRDLGRSLDGNARRGHFDPCREYTRARRPSVVRRRVIDSTQVERKVESADVFMHAHDACYKLWREESAAHRRT